MGRRAVLLRMFTHTAGQNNIKQVQFLAFYLFIYSFYCYSLLKDHYPGLAL